jgi:flagellar FliJ protein
MARRKVDRFQLLQKLANRYEDMAAKDLGVSVGNLDAQKLRLVELIKFREEYTSQFYQTGSLGISSAAMQSFQRFINQIDVAIEQQKQTLEYAKQDHSRKQEVWKGKHKTTQVYEKTIERCQEKEQKVQDLREQNEQDDRNNSRIHEHDAE